MSVNIRDYVSNDHIESIGEIAKSQSAIIQALSIDNSKLQQELQRKDNEIKQLREDIVNHIKIASEYKEQMIIKDNNWNELKKWLNDVCLDPHCCFEYRIVLDKIKDIENER